MVKRSWVSHSFGADISDKRPPDAAPRTMTPARLYTFDVVILAAQVSDSATHDSADDDDGGGNSHCAPPTVQSPAAFRLTLLSYSTMFPSCVLVFP